MGMFDGKVIEKRWQCYFPDDDTFQFRKLEVEDTFLIERGKQREVVRGWKDLRGNRFSCPGYRQAHIPPCSVTFSHPRDIIFEVVPGIIPNAQRPDGGRTSMRRTKDGTGVAFSVEGERERLKEVATWCASVGDFRLLRAAAKKLKQASMDKLIMWLGIIGLVEGFSLLMVVGFQGGIHL